MRKTVLFVRFMIVLFALNFFAVSGLFSQQDYRDSCLKLIWPHDPANGYDNIDSVMYDSCVCGDIFEYYYKNTKWPTEYYYAKRWFITFLPIGALDIPRYKRDTIIERKWTDISSSFTILRNEFKKLEDNYGSFIMRKRFPDDIDTSVSKVWLIKFDKYVNIIELEWYFFEKFESFDYSERPFYMRQYDLNNPQNLKSEFLNSFFNISPQPADNHLILKIYNSGQKRADIKIYDILGNIKYSQEIFLNNSDFEYTIDTSMLENGIYFMQFDDEIRKFVLMR